MPSPCATHPAKPILIVLAGDTYEDISRSEGGFGDWIADGLGKSVPHRRIDARSSPDMPAPSDIAGVVVSGSHAMVSDRLPWSEQLAQWLKTCVEAAVPVLGICYGHQLLAHALGGQVADHPQGIEIGTKEIRLTEAAAQDPLFMALPQTFPAQLVHRQSVRVLPPQATLLACNTHEAHQAFRVGDCAWGVQFHPEFSAAAMQGYLARLAAEHAGRQSDSTDAIAAVQATPEAASLLGRFAALALSRSKSAA